MKTRTLDECPPGIDSEFDDRNRCLVGSIALIHQVRIPLSDSGQSVGCWLDEQIETALHDKETIGEFRIDLSPLFTRES